MNRKIRFLSLILAVVMVFSVIPFTAFASDTSTGITVGEGSSNGNSTNTEIAPADDATDTNVTEVGSEKKLAFALLSSGTVKLTTDIEMVDVLEISTGAIITLDLGGHTLTLPRIINYGELTITNGKVVAAEYESEYHGAVVVNREKLVTDADLVGVASVIRAEEGSVTINGGSVTMTGNGDITHNAIRVKGGTVTINGGTFTCFKDAQSANGNYIIGPDAGTTVVINGGTFQNYTVIGFNRSVYQGVLTITGGKFFVNTTLDGFKMENLLAKYVPQGYKIVADESAMVPAYDVVDANAAKIGETKYETLDAAFAAAVEGDTITLLADATPALTRQSAITKAAVIDLNGKTLTLTEDDLYFGTTTFQNGTIKVAEDVNASTAVFWMFEGQTLTFENVEIVATGVTGTYLIGINAGTNSKVELISSTITIANTDTAGLTAVIADNGNGNNVVIKNSTIDVDSIEGRFYLGGENGTVTVTDSKIDLNGVKEGFYLRGGQELAIEGESEVNITLNADTEARYGINVNNGATYTKAYTATVNATSNTPTYVAAVGETYYTDIQEAIKAAAPAGTVEILSDVTVDKWIMFSESLSIANGNIITLTINDLTINGNGHTLTINSIVSADNGNRLFYDSTKLNIKNLTIKYADGVAGGIGLQSGTIENVIIDGGDYGVLPGAGEVTIKECTFKTNSTAIYFESDRDNLTVTGNTFEVAADANVILLRGSVEFTDNTVISGRTVNVVSGSPVVSGNDFGEVRLKVYNGATATIEENTINTLVFNDATEAQSKFAGNNMSDDAKAALAAVTPATYEVGEGKTYATLNDAMAQVAIDNPSSVTYRIYGAVTLETGHEIGTVALGNNVTIEGVVGENAKLTVIGGGVPEINGITMKNITFADEGSNYAPNANEFMYQNFRNTTFEKVTFEDGIRLSGNCSLNNCIVNANTVNEYAIWLDAGEFTIRGTTVTAENDAYGMIKSDNAEKITLTGNTFTYTGTANKEALNVKGATIIAEGNTFNYCTKGVVPADKTNYTANGETITDEIIAENNKVWNYVVSIGDTHYTTLDDALAAAKDGDEVVILKAGTYSLNGIRGKNITVTGAEGIVVEFANIGAFRMDASVTFNNVTFTYASNSTYKGLQHAGSLVYNNCTFNGQVFLYGESETFNKCTFNQTSADSYNVWTYGAKVVEFNGCTFNCAGKAVLVYAENASITNEIKITDTEFIASASVDGKAAIEIDTSLTAGASIKVDNTTATGFAAGSKSGSPLWNNKKGSEGENNDITVVVDGKTEISPIVPVAYVTVARVGKTDTYYFETLEAAIEFANDQTQCNGNTTIVIIEDVTVSSTIVLTNPSIQTIMGEKNATITITSDAEVAINVNNGNYLTTIQNLTLNANGAVAVEWNVILPDVIKNEAGGIHACTINAAGTAIQITAEGDVSVALKNTEINAVTFVESNVTGTATVRLNDTTVVCNGNGIAAIEVLGGKFMVSDSINGASKSNTITVNGQNLLYVTYVAVAANADTIDFANQAGIFDDVNVNVTLDEGYAMYVTDEAYIQEQVAAGSNYAYYYFPSLKDALEYANNYCNGNTALFITKDVTVDYTIEITNRYVQTLKALNGVTVTSYADVAISVNNGNNGTTIQNLTLIANGDVAVEWNAPIVTVNEKGGLHSCNIVTEGTAIKITAEGDVSVALKNTKVTAGKLVESNVTGTATVRFFNTTVNCTVNGIAAIEVLGGKLLLADTISGDGSRSSTITVTGNVMYVAYAAVEANDVDFENQTGILEDSELDYITIEATEGDKYVTDVAYIGETYYQTFADAYNAAVDSSDTIVLLTDVATDAAINLNKAITLDGNGKTLTTTAEVAMWIMAAANVEDLTVNGTKFGIVVYTGESVALDNVTVNATYAVYTYADVADGSSLTITGSKLNGWAALALNAASEVYVIDSELVGTNNVADVSANVFGTIAIQGANVTLTVTGDSTISATGTARAYAVCVDYAGLNGADITVDESVTVNTQVINDPVVFYNNGVKINASSSLKYHDDDAGMQDSAIRFGYNIVLPKDVTINSISWNYGADANLGYTYKATEWVPNGDGSVTANAVFELYAHNYANVLYVQLVVEYTDKYGNECTFVDKVRADSIWELATWYAKNYDEDSFKAWYVASYGEADETVIHAEWVKFHNYVFVISKMYDKDTNGKVVSSVYFAHVGTYPDCDLVLVDGYEYDYRGELIVGITQTEVKAAA